jgi:hypothetical protein
MEGKDVGPIDELDNFFAVVVSIENVLHIVTLGFHFLAVPGHVEIFLHFCIVF